jgi:hypothetical protein
VKTQELKLYGWAKVLLIIIPYLFFVGIFQLIGGLLFGIDFSNPLSNKTSIQLLAISLFGLIGAFLTLWLVTKFVDRERLYQLGFQTKNRSIDFMIGIAIGLIIFSSGYLVLIHFNEIVFVKIDLNVNEILISVLHFTIVAVVEETLFRGYILKNFMESFNKYAALIISSGLFSIMHYFNPDFDLFSFFSLFSAGILFGISYIYTKNLWFPIALHLSWNLFQALFGFNVSGRDTFSIIEFKILESNLINGGSFGFEGSVLSIIAQVIIITIIITYYRRKKISWLIK